MQIKIFGECYVPKEQEVLLSLEDTDDGVSVVIVNTAGETIDGGLLVEFRDDGTMYRYNNISKETGFRRNKGNHQILERA
jgi:hypothetical protein